MNVAVSERLREKAVKSYGNAFISGNSNVQQGDTSHDVNVLGNIDGGLHLHFNYSDQRLPEIAVVGPLFGIAVSLSKRAGLLRSDSDLSRVFRVELESEIQHLLGALCELELQLHAYCATSSRSLSSSQRQRDSSDLTSTASLYTRRLLSLLQNLPRSRPESIRSNIVLAFRKLWTEGGLKDQVTAIDALAISLIRRVDLSTDITLKTSAQVDQNSSSLHGLQHNVPARDSVDESLFQPAISPTSHSTQRCRDLTASGNPLRPIGSMMNIRSNIPQSGQNALADSRRQADLAESLNFRSTILSCLYFTEIQDRFVEVRNAHRETFRWLFRKIPIIEPGSFRSWLTSDMPIFWINGKAGSGKSTLMKFIYHEPSFKDLLKKWARNRRLLLCNFFFWYAGTDLQKSQEGMMRSLLQQVLEVRPDLTPILFPRLTRDILMKKDIHVDITILDLQEAVRLLARNVPDDLALFILVDGIDEYHGSQFEFSTFLVDIAKNSPIRLLVSSRPTSECYQIFSKYPSLRLQDLTKGDIEAYIQEELLNDQLFIDLATLEPGIDMEVKQKLTETSCGVFLWIVIVVRQLLVSLGRYDDKETLFEVIDELPTDLENLYDHMFSKISNEYRQEGSLILQLLMALKSFGSGNKLWTLQLYAILRKRLDDQFSETCNVWDGNQAALRVKSIEGRLRSRCCGLLEVYCGSNERNSWVDVLHRTVYEYLHDASVHAQIGHFSARSLPRIHLALLAGAAQYLKCVPAVDRGTIELTTLVRLSQELSKHGITDYVRYMHVADKYGQISGTRAWARCRIDNDGDTRAKRLSHWPSEILDVALARLPEYFDYWLSQDLWLYYRIECDQRTLSNALLDLLVICGGECTAEDVVQIHSRTISHLLGHEADPNMLLHRKFSCDGCDRSKPCVACESSPSSGITPWDLWMILCDMRRCHLELTLLLLKAGARTDYGQELSRLRFDSFRTKTLSYATSTPDKDLKLLIEDILSHPQQGPISIQKRQRSDLVDIDCANSARSIKRFRPWE